MMSNKEILYRHYFLTLFKNTSTRRFKKTRWFETERNISASGPYWLCKSVLDDVNATKKNTEGLIDDQ